MMLRMRQRILSIVSRRIKPSAGVLFIITVNEERP